jgi:hypothetical protein
MIMNPFAEGFASFSRPAPIGLFAAKQRTESTQLKKTGDLDPTSF